MTSGLKYPPFAHPRRGTPAKPAKPVTSPETLPSIDDFLDELPSIDDFLAQDSPVAPFSAEVSESEADVEPQESGSEEQAFEEQYFESDSFDSQAETTLAPQPTADGWAAGDWQSYDWGSLASLNRNAPLSAADSWGETDWPLASESGSQPGRTSATPDADEIADALVGIAHRIRSGELVINNLHGTTPEAAMAAALAVLLRMRG